MAGKIEGLAHIGIYTKDIDVSVAFYRRLGFLLEGTSNPGSKLAFMSLGDCPIELIQPGDPSRLDGLSGGAIAHIALRCEGIEQVVEELKRDGIIEEDATVRVSDKILNGIKNIFFTGPSAERIELFETLR